MGTVTDAARSAGMRGTSRLRICDTTSAVPIGNGLGKVALERLIIFAAATPVTATVVGFLKRSNTGVEAAQSWVITGPDADLAAGAFAHTAVFDFGGAVNEGAAMTVTASADEQVAVVWRDLS